MGIFDLFRPFKAVERAAETFVKVKEFFAPEKVSRALEKTIQSPIAQTGFGVAVTAGTALVAPLAAIPVAIGSAIAAGILRSSPKAAATTTKAIEAFDPVGAGEVIGGIIEGKEDSKVKDALVKGGIGAGLIAGAIAIAPKVSEKVKGIFEKEDKEVAAVVGKPLLPDTTTELIPERATTTVSPTKPRKRRTAKKTPSVRQSVRISICNSNSVRRLTKNYIKERCLC